MKFNSFKFLFSLLGVVLLSSCLDTNNDVVLSTDPTFVSLTFGANDNAPNQASAVFTVEFDSLLNKGVIVNLDSLPYQTPIDVVYPTFKFTSTSSASIYFSDGTSKALTGTDTIDFSKVDRIRNVAADGENTVEYEIKVNVHQIEPDLYVWKNLGEKLETENVLYQKTIMRDDKLYYFFNDGISAFLSTSEDGVSWDKKTLTNFPVNSPLDDIKLYNGSFYLTQDGKNIYSSVDGEVWTKSVKEFEFKSLLFNFENKLWAVVKTTDTGYYFANSMNGSSWTVQSDTIPLNFPVHGFSTISFSTRTGKPKVLVVGGYNSDNVYNNTSWSSEDCNYWIDLSSTISGRANALKTLLPGASVITYDDKLLLFGAENKDGALGSSYFRQSIDEGYSWQVPDSLTTIQFSDIIQVPDTAPGTQKDSIIYIPMPIRTAQSVVVNNDKKIFIVGGKDNNGLRKDVWTGKLNRFSFLK